MKSVRSTERITGPDEHISEATPNYKSSSLFKDQMPTEHETSDEQSRAISRPEYRSVPPLQRSLIVLQQKKWDFVLLLVTTALFAITAWFAQSTFSVSSMANMK